MNLKRGDIVLVPFPFTDLSSQKVRPAVVLTPAPESSDILIAFISSVVQPKAAQPTYYVLKEQLKGTVLFNPENNKIEPSPITHQSYTRILNGPPSFTFSTRI